MRITYNHCIDGDSFGTPPDGCPFKGDMNMDGHWNSSDVPLFYAVYGAPLAAPRDAYCRADLDGDGYITSLDEACFLLATATDRAPICTALCAEVIGGGLGEDGAMAAGNPEGGEGLFQAQLALLRAWDAMNPRWDYAGLSDNQYLSRRHHYMADIGMITLALADGIDVFLAWKSVNRREDHPELSAADYAQLVLAAYEAYVGCNVGGNP